MTDFEVPLERKWSEAAIIKNNALYGNYVVASRLIQEGELLIKEFPLMVGPYGTSDDKPYCLTCAKAVGHTDRCSNCNWPICSKTCENHPVHSLAECQIFVKNQINPLMNTRSEYSAVEVIRGLLLKSTDVAKWERILMFESHLIGRKSCPTANALTEFIVNFVREKCKMLEYDLETLDKVIGVFAVNTFWSVKETGGRNLSLLFDKVTLLTHDCDPNTKRLIVTKDVIDEHGNKENFQFILIVARRAIMPGETISIYYIDPDQTVLERQQILKSLFYFSCNCTRCVLELMKEVDISNGNTGVSNSLSTDQPINHQKHANSEIMTWQW